MSYTTLVLSGGSVKGVGFLGALHHIERTSGLKHINRFYCTSVGSIVSVFTALGWTPIQLFCEFLRFRFSIQPTITMTKIEMLNYDKFISTLENMLIERLGYIPTLKDIYSLYGKRLYIVTYNYLYARQEVLTPDTHGSMPCTEAIRLSCALPFLFGRAIYKGNLYFDGGIVCNFPLDLAIETGARNILALNMSTDKERSLDDNNFSVLFNVIFAPIEHKTREIVTKYKACCKYVELVIPISFTDFHLSTGVALQCYLIGYLTARMAI